MASSKLELVNDAYALVILSNYTKVSFKTNQTLLDRDSNQTEALLQPDQTIYFGVVADDCAKRCFETSGWLMVDNKQFDMNFDRWKYYLKFQKPTESNLTKYEIFELNSALDYNPKGGTQDVLRAIRN